MNTAVVNQKGGVAKTTSVANIAAAWGGAGYKTLAVDIDPQFNLTSSFGQKASELPTSIFEVIANAEDVKSAIIEQVVDGVDLLPAKRELLMLEASLVTEIERERFLQGALQEVQDSYDIIIIDCPADLGQLTINALYASEHILVPIAMTDINALQGMAELRGTLDKISKRGEEKQIDCVFKVKARPTRKIYRLVEETLPDFDLPIVKTEVPLSAELDNSLVEDAPLVTINPEHRASLAYAQLAQEIHQMLAQESETRRVA